MITIEMFSLTGTFAEDKDVAQRVRLEMIEPALNRGDVIELDFSRVDEATQSFVHALLSQLIRDYGPEVLDKISFKNCNDTVKKIISIVIDYMQA